MSALIVNPATRSFVRLVSQSSHTHARTRTHPASTERTSRTLALDLQCAHAHTTVDVTCSRNGDFEVMTNTVGAALGLVEMVPSRHDPTRYAKGNVVSMGDNSSPPRGSSHNSADAVRVQIWDTAGQEQYSSLLPMYFRNADVRPHTHSDASP